MEDRDSSDEETGLSFRHKHQPGVGISWENHKPPTELEALTALKDVEDMLRPYKIVGEKKRKEYQPSTVHGWPERILRQIMAFLNLYMGAKSSVKGQWIPASKLAVQSLGKSTNWASRKLRENAKNFVFTRELQESPYGLWNISRIDEDEEFKQEISLHLQSKGKYIKAADIVEYLNEPEVKKRWDIDKSISLATAKCWMTKLGYRWVKKHRGLYFDGHEREDVVDYCQNHFLPTWNSLLPRMQKWNKNGNQEPLNLATGVKTVVPWFNDESIFYGNDRRQSGWVHKDASPEPYKKGEGASKMFAEFFSPDYGYLTSHDGSKSARVIWKPGKNGDGYFDNEDFLKQVDMAIDILTEDYPDEDHLLVFDNATTHLKRPEDALSASKMPKFTSREGSNWGVEVTKRDEAGKIIYGPDGKPLKTKIWIADGWFNGQQQSFYFEEGHPQAGVFKGMAVILQEWGYANASSLRAQCKGFKCPQAPQAAAETDQPPNCCCRHLLYSQPDFVNVKSLLEEHCEKRGFMVLILPKYHCELNPIEMVWGRAKYYYHLNPPSTKEEDVERYAMAALAAVTIDEM